MTSQKISPQKTQARVQISCINFASKTSIASSKDNVVVTAMPVPLPTEQLEYDPSINQLLLTTSHGSNFFVSPITIAN